MPISVIKSAIKGSSGIQSHNILFDWHGRSPCDFLLNHALDVALRGYISHSPWSILKESRLRCEQNFEAQQPFYPRPHLNHQPHIYQKKSHQSWDNVELLHLKTFESNLLILPDEFPLDLIMKNESESHLCKEVNDMLRYEQPLPTPNTIEHKIQREDIPLFAFEIVHHLIDRFREWVYRFDLASDTVYIYSRSEINI